MQGTRNASCAGQGGHMHSSQHNRQHNTGVNACMRGCACVVQAQLGASTREQSWARVPWPNPAHYKMAAAPTVCTERHQLQTAQRCWCLALSAPASEAWPQWQDIGWLGCEILPCPTRTRLAWQGYPAWSALTWYALQRHSQQSSPRWMLVLPHHPVPLSAAARFPDDATHLREMGMRSACG